MRTDEAQVVGPGRLPCRLFSLSGNLTGEGVEAQMWTDVDGPGLLSYYFADLQAVEALQYDTPRQLVRDVWAFLREFTGDLRFADDSWIKAGWEQADGPLEDGAGQEQRPRDPELDPGSVVGLLRSRQLVAGGARARRERHGPMRVYRSSETRMVVKVPTGCKYRYTVNPTSHVFESPARQHAHVQWRMIGLTVATLSVILAVVGLGACTYFSHKHAEYVSSYWEYQAVKDQLGSELPPATYQRLFGEAPKSAAAAADAADAARLAVGARSKDRLNSGGAAVAAVAASLSPAVQQHAPAALQAAAGEAPLIGAGEADGISSRSSSAAGSELLAAAVAEADAAPPVLVASSADAAGRK